MAAKIKGPLTLGSEAADMDYNATMKDLTEQLIGTPESREKDELLAWGGGLTDPSGQGRLGDAFINAGATQSKYRQKEHELRASYIPAIMSALAQQAQSQQLIGMSGEQLRGMSLERMTQISQATGKDLLPAWEIANDMKTAPAGSYTRGFANGQNTLGFLPDTTKASPVIQGNTVIGAANLPGVATASGQMKGAEAAGTEIGKNIAGTTKTIGPGGAAGVSPTAQVLPQITDPSVLGKFETQPVPTGPSTGGIVPAQGTPTGAAPQGQPPAPTVQARPTPTPAPAGVSPMRGNWQGTPEAILEMIDKFPPQIRDQMKASYANQMAGTNPPADPNYTPKFIAKEEKDVVPTGAPAAAPGAPAFVQQELSPGQVQQNKNIADLSTSAQKDYDDLMAQSKTFDKEATNIKQLEQLNKLGKTGPYTTEVRVGVAKILAAAGIQADEKYLTNYQAVQQAMKSRVNDAIMADRGVATEGDAKRHEQALTSFEGTPKYNQYMIDVYKANLEMARKKAAFYRDAFPSAASSGKGDTSVVARDWASIKPELFDMPSLKKYK